MYLSLFCYFCKYLGRAFTGSIPLCSCCLHYAFELIGWWVTRMSIQLCTLCLCMSLTWSSRGRSQKAGMYLAHSTNTSSCCFMDSHTSVMLAIFLVLMSPFSIGAGEVIWTRDRADMKSSDAQLHVINPSLMRCVESYLSWQYVCLDECIDGW